MTVTFVLNSEPTTYHVDPEMPLLWALREVAELTGTKFGCGVGACGACTVHVNGAAVRSCVVPMQAVAGARIVTIEGLATHVDGSGVGGSGKAAPAASDLHAVQQAWIDLQVPQCGYCQSGMIMAVAALLQATPHPTDADIDAAITNLCRCGTYPRVRSAIHLLAKRT